MNTPNDVTTSTNFYADNEDLRWYVERGIDWAPLVEGAELGGGEEGEGFGSVAEALEFYTEVLNLIGEFAATEIAPHAAEFDREGVKLVDGEVVMPERLQGVFAQLAEMGLHGLCVPRDLGGMSAPMMLYLLSIELMGRADVSVMAHHGFHGGMALAMLMYSAIEGTTEIEPETLRIRSTRWAEGIEQILAGEAWGSMDITEAGAGSDMGAIRCVGEKDAEGRWTVTGEKIFITSGHGRYHFVIARTAEASAEKMGLDGLSLFLVEAWTEGEGGERQRHVTVERVEEKLGHHASPTVTVRFEQSPAELVGEEGEGFKLMLLLMNNARISVGFESLGLAECAWRMARDYAAQRHSMGKPIARHELIADMLDEMQTEIQGLRALCVYAAEKEELHQRTRLRSLYLHPEGSPERAALEKQVRALSWQSRLVTPLVKYLGAERAVEIARRALQIHGGYGYTAEYGAEKLLRDSLVLPIYEGTSQIQALMATKDSLLHALKDPKRFMRQQTSARWRRRVASDPLEREVAGLRADALAAMQALMTRIVKGKLGGKGVGELKSAMQDWDPKRDFGPALLHAERLTTMLADAKVAEILWAQAQAHPERREPCARWVERATPRSRDNLHRIRHTGDRLLASLA
ncbi:MAG: acyl-CoA dehydrogenase family protein [Alphaproteobacteria bacterium]|nr:acyl-CoA dehydrogenase family protein [Alphaproteobacteria bacterium]